MITRQQVVKFVQDRRELSLILEIIIKEGFKLDFDVKQIIENPTDYCSRFFAAKGMQLMSRFGNDALKIGQKFKKKVKENGSR